jgi:hypothetical protein
MRAPSQNDSHLEFPFVAAWPNERGVAALLHVHVDKKATFSLLYSSLVHFLISFSSISTVNTS